MGGTGVLDFISFVPWTFIVMIANAYILYRLVRHFLFKPVKELFKKRQEEIDAIYDGANQLQIQAEQANAEYNEKLEGAKEEASLILQEAGDNAKEIVTNGKSIAKQEARQIIENADAQAKLLQKKMESEMQQNVAELSIEIAKKVTEKEISRQDHIKLIEDSLRQIQEDAI